MWHTEASPVYRLLPIVIYIGTSLFATKMTIRIFNKSQLLSNWKKYLFQELFPSDILNQYIIDFYTNSYVANWCKVLIVLATGMWFWLIYSISWTGQMVQNLGNIPLEWSYKDANSENNFESRVEQNILKTMIFYNFRLKNNRLSILFKCQIF